MALAGERNELSGEIWTSGACSLGQTILGTTESIKDIGTIGEGIEGSN
jgi:hypothetical protein